MQNSLDGGRSLTIAVYPGTFDPVHYGHIDIVIRALKIFDKLIVGVYDRPNKNILFSTDERVEMVREALKDLAGVEVTSYSGLTVDFVAAQHARVIVRGLRVISDFELEYQMALTTRKLAPQVDMVCLMTSLEYAFMSSTIIKEIAAAGGAVDQFVPAEVQAALKARFTSQKQRDAI
jgi:pantetheine-phosphate adenylyltransferase